MKTNIRFIRTLVALKKAIKYHSPQEKVSLKQIFSAIGTNSFNIFILIFTLPLALPIPHPPGSSTIFALPILFCALQMILGFRSLKLGFLGNIKIKKKTLESLFKQSSKVGEKFMKWRFKYFKMFNKRINSSIIGVLYFIFCLSFLVPIPAVAFASAVGIVLISVGSMLEDVLVVFIGITFGIIGLATTTVAVVWGKYLVTKILALFK